MIILGYLTDNTNYAINDKNLGRLTHINYAFAEVSDLKGTVTENWKNAKKIKLLKEKFPSLKIQFSIGGWSSGNFSEACECEENRANFSKTAIEIMKKYSFDGIDIDWEYPGISSGIISSHPNDKFNFTLLLKKLRKDLNSLSKKDNKKYLLTIACGGKKEDVSKTEMNKISEVLDFINVMTYDLGGAFSVTGHHTPVYKSTITGQEGSFDAMERIVKMGVPASKLVLGIAFYGRGATGVENKDDGILRRIYGVEGKYWNYHDILKLIKEKEYKTYFDKQAIASWAFNGDTFITFEDERSIIAKIKLVKKQNYGGVMFWEYSTDNTYRLINTIFDEIKI